MSDPGFVVGARYATAAGEYTVLALSGSTVHIRYDNGFEMSLPAQGLWAQWEAIVRERTSRPNAAPRPPAGQGKAAARTATAPSRSEPAPSRAAAGPRMARAKRAATGDAGFFTTAGYLAAGCEITASVAGRDYPAFAQRYRILTARNLITPHAGLEIHERPTHKIGAELAVRFPATPEALSYFDLGPAATPEPAPEPGQYLVVRADLVERLLKLGFDLGSNTDPRPIREQVPEAQRGAFDRGLSLRRSLHG